MYYIGYIIMLHAVKKLFFATDFKLFPHRPQVY